MAVNSAAAGLALVARHWLQPGDEAIVWDPVDFLLPHVVRASGGVPVLWSIERHGPLDLEALERLITPRTRLLCLCNPHNPLGRCFSRQELESLGRLCLARGLRVLSDEVWSDIVYPPAVFTSWLALEPSLAAIGAVVQGFSKGFALAGLRVGAVAMADPEALAALLAASDHPSTVDGVATLSQVAAAAACSPEGLAWLAAFLEHLRQRRDQTIDALRAIPGLRVSRPEATYVAFVGLPAGGEEPEALVERLRLAHGLALVPGSPRWFGPGGAGHVRLCFATSEAILAEGLRRFSAGMAAAQPGRGSSG
jgi:aspartate/methionine/tyrosine aminotransferase